MSSSEKQQAQLSPTSSQAKSAEAVAGSLFQVEEDEIQEERCSQIINEGGLSSVKDLIEVVTELEHSSEMNSTRNSQAKL